MDRCTKGREGVRLRVENSDVGLSDAIVKLARAFRLAGRFDDALEQYSEALNRVSAGGTTAVLAQDVYLGVGEVYLQQKKASLAIESFQKALALAEAEQRTDGINSASAGLGASYRQAGRATDAIPYYQKAIQQTESTRSLLQSDDYRQSFFEGSLNAYFGMIESLSDSGKADEAFGFSERARSRSFLDLLGSKAQLSRLTGGFRDEEQALQQRIAGMKALLAVQVGEDDDDDEEESEEIDAATLRNQLAEAETAYSNFLSRVKKEDKEQASLMNVEPLTLKQTQELLEPGVTLLEYFITNDSVLVWIVDKGTVNSVTVRLSRKELQAKVAALRESISQLEDMAKLNQQAQELFKSLIQPALPHIRGKELLIIPHDVLHYLPFQALLSPSGKYLIEDYSINYLSSASLMQFTQEKRKAKGELTSVIAQGGKLLTFGNPDLNDPKMALQFAEIEAKEIKTLYPQSSIYLQKEATEEKAKALSPQNDIVHFASHAELNEDDPLASAIRLAKSDKEDGRLEVREIFGMDLKASLVVLSACETGLGKLSSGDELVGLTRAFIYAGTPSVVASLWNVEDSSTAQLMASFYKNLKTMTKVEALRQAQLNLIRGNINSDLLARRGIGGIGKLGEVTTSKTPSQDSNPIAISTSHPFFWAPFILVGEGK
jgi:CHAT domain-containing protein